MPDRNKNTRSISVTGKCHEGLRGRAAALGVPYAVVEVVVSRSIGIADADLPAHIRSLASRVPTT